MTDEERNDREAIRVLMARYNINGDQGKIDGLVATFTEDGTLHFNNEGSTGHAAILARALGVPAVGGLRGMLDSAEQGDDEHLPEVAERHSQAEGEPDHDAHRSGACHVISHSQFHKVVTWSEVAVAASPSGAVPASAG